MFSPLAHRLRTVLLAAGGLLGGAAGLLAQNTVNLPKVRMINADRINGSPPAAVPSRTGSRSLCGRETSG